MKRFLVIAAILSLVLLLFDSRFLGIETWHWRQKLVLEVETPHGIVSGGSVVQIDLSRGPPWLPTDSGTSIVERVKGEASLIEVAPGRYLFALLGGGAESGVARALFSDGLKRITYSEANDQVIRARGSAEVPPKLYPRLVTFVNMSDPKTVRRVDPANLAATFGPGYRLKSVRLEITGESVTKGEVEKVLPWLNNLEKFLRDPDNPFSSTLPRYIGRLRTE